MQNGVRVETGTQTPWAPGQGSFPPGVSCQPHCNAGTAPSGRGQGEKRVQGAWRAMEVLKGKGVERSASLPA